MQALHYTGVTVKESPQWLKRQIISYWAKAD